MFLWLRDDAKSKQGANMRLTVVTANQAGGSMEASWGEQSEIFQYPGQASSFMQRKGAREGKIATDEGPNLSDGFLSEFYFYPLFEVPSHRKLGTYN